MSENPIRYKRVGDGSLQHLKLATLQFLEIEATVFNYGNSEKY